MSQKNIFICYRRDDAEGYAGRIYDRLQQHFPGRVLMDISGISFGADFFRVVENQLRDCGACIVIIGREWLSLRDEQGQRRIEQKDDFVRLEIATAIATNVPLIPVLVRGASMPSEIELPPVVAPLVLRNAIEISDADFDRDVKRLTAALGYLFADAERSYAGSVTKEISTDVVPNADFVFISYDRDDDEGFALQLAAKIKEHGVNVWVDQWNLEPSEDWDRSIDEALDKCARFLIVLSPSSVNSDEVRGELRFALDEKKPIVPVLYKDCSIPRRLRLTQHADFRSRSLDDEAEMNELLKALKGRRK